VEAPVKDIEIREATRDDLMTVVATYNLMWTDSKSPLDMKMAKNFFDGLERHPNHHMYVATTTGRIVGVFVLMIKDVSSGHESVLENVAVHPKFQGQGIGKEILSFVVDRSRKLGCARVIHSSRERRETASGFYEAHGFRRRGFNFVLDI